MAADDNKVISGMEIQLYQGSPVQNVVHKVEGLSNEQNSGPGPSRKQRRLTTSNVIETTKVFFQVFKYPGDAEEYLLEMHQVETGIIDRYHLIVGQDKEERKWSVEIYDLEGGDHVVFPMTEDPRHPIFLKKYQLSLQERLQRWIVEKRMRTKNSKEETFYRHWSRTFRSFLEVAGFILYSCEPKHLQAIRQEEQAAMAIMQISSIEEMNRNDP